MRRILGGLSAISLGLGLTLSVAALAPGQTGTETDTDAGKSKAPATATTPPVPLAQYVPAENLVALVEFTGLDAHGDAWRDTSAYKILNTTTTGAMLENLLSQVFSQVNPAGAATRLTGAEYVTLAEHLFRNGFVLGVQSKTGSGDDAAGHAVIVMRNAATKDARPLFGKLLGQAMGPESKPTTQVKGSRKTVLVTPAEGTPWAWWPEKDDLVITLTADDVELILNTLDGKEKSATEHPLRQELAAAEGAFQPIGLAFLDPKALPALPAEATNALRSAGLDKVQRADFRWGVENAALMSVLRVQAPAPRQGLLAIADQPTFAATNLPLMPASALNFTALSLNPATLLDGLKAASASNPQLADGIAAAEARVQERTRRRLNEDILAQLGPKMVVFSTPSRTTASRGGPLAALGASLQVPRGAIAIEVKDPAEFSKTLDELIVFANREMDDQLPAFSPIFAPPPERTDNQNRPGAARKKGPTQNPNVPRFQLLSPQNPKLYLLRLPTALGALTNMNLTVALGKKHLVIATAADLARETLALEDKTEGRWVPAGELAQTFAAFPEGLTLLQVTDPSTTMPEALANLPRTIASLNPLLAAASRPATPGQPATPAGATPADTSMPVGDDAVAPPPGDSGDAVAPPGDPGDSGGALVPAGTPGGGAPGTDPGSDAAAGTVRAPISIRLDPAQAPKAEEIRPHLFPGSSALSVIGAEIRFESRTAFPNFVTGSSGASAAMMIPMLQGARRASQGSPPNADDSLAPGETAPPGESAPQ